MGIDRELHTYWICAELGVWFVVIDDHHHIVEVMHFTWLGFLCYLDDAI